MKSRFWSNLRVALLTSLLTAAAILSPQIARGQSSAPIVVTMASTRFEITRRIAQIDAQLALPATKGKARERLVAEAAALRNRLQEGDFRVGERFMLTLIKDTVRTDSVTVRDSLLIGISNLPDMSLRGVLRAELTPRIQAFVAEFLLNVGVRTQILTRVAVMGEVGKPGFYYVSPDRPVSEAVSLAGGQSMKADFKRLEVRRGDKTYLSAKKSEQAVKDGKTLEQLGIQNGDEIRIPTMRTINWGVLARVLLLASSLFFAIINFLRFYYAQQQS